MYVCMCVSCVPTYTLRGQEMFPCILGDPQRVCSLLATGCPCLAPPPGGLRALTAHVCLLQHPASLRPNQVGARVLSSPAAKGETKGSSSTICLPLSAMGRAVSPQVHLWKP